MLTTFESPLQPRKNRWCPFEYHGLSRAAVDKGSIMTIEKSGSWSTAKYIPGTVRRCIVAQACKGLEGWRIQSSCVVVHTYIEGGTKKPPPSSSFNPPKLSFQLQQSRGYLIAFIGKAKGERDSGLLAVQ